MNTVDLNNLPVHTNMNTLSAIDYLPFLDCVRTFEAELFDGRQLPWQHVPGALADAVWAEEESARALLPYVRGMVRKFARRIGPLNGFLKEHGFDPMFSQEFGPEGAGVVSISKRVVRYHDPERAKACNVRIGGLGTEVAGFMLQPHQYRAWNIGGPRPLFEILTDQGSEDTLWVLEHPDRLSTDRLIAVVRDAMSQPRQLITYIDEGLVMPNLVFRAKPDVGGLVGSKVEYELPLGELSQIIATAGGLFPGVGLDEVVKLLVIALTEVHQEFVHLRSKDGAASFTATGASAVLSASGPYMIDGPHASWFTPKYRDIDPALAEELRNGAILAPFWTAPDLDVWGKQFSMGDALKKWGGSDVKAPESLPARPAPAVLG